MRLEPHRKLPEPRSYVTWDLEWIPGSHPEKARALGFEPLQLRLAGIFDGSEYRAYGTIEEFLDEELTPENSGKWFYAHAGGLADLQFILEYVLQHNRRGYFIEAAFSGSSAIIVEFHKDGHKWIFVDSLWLMRTSLRKIGKWLGEEKGGEGQGGETDIDTFYAPWAELRDYNEKDCRILYKAIQAFETVVLELGGQLEKTVASTAMKLFRMRYLKHTIRLDDRVNAMSRDAYVASRVEVHRKIVRNSNYYDINSSFPHAMTLAAPANPKSSRRTIPKGEGQIYLAKADVSVPDCEVPPLPFRTQDRRVYFPVGAFQGYFSNVDLELLEECGGRILRIYEVQPFEQFSDLADYAEDIYSRRKSSNDEAYKQILKILLNSLYGKFAESERKSKVAINPHEKWFKGHPSWNETTGLGYRYLQPDVFELIEERAVRHAHVPISMHITAHARAALTRYMRQASEVYYCDTDGFAVSEADVFPTSNELGGLKLEKFIRQGHFEAPKLYAYETPDGTWEIKAKGFSRVKDEEGEGSHKLSYEDFCSLLGKRELQIEMFGRIKGNLKAGRTSPREFSQKKRYRGVEREKRKPLSDGSTVPWNVRELMSDHTKTSDVV